MCGRDQVRIDIRYRTVFTPTSTTEPSHCTRGRGGLELMVTSSLEWTAPVFGLQIPSAGNHSSDDTVARIDECSKEDVDQPSERS